MGLCKKVRKKKEMTKPKFIDLTEPFVSKYVFCLKRANHAQIHVSICEKVCKDSSACAEYQRYLAQTQGNRDRGPGRLNGGFLSLFVV